jgi:hypothetical protein
MQYILCLRPGQICIEIDKDYLACRAVKRHGIGCRAPDKTASDNADFHVCSFIRPPPKHAT